MANMSGLLIMPMGKHFDLMENSSFWLRFLTLERNVRKGVRMRKVNLRINVLSGLFLSLVCLETKGLKSWWTGLKKLTFEVR